jgi:hypothetical protein
MQSAETLLTVPKEYLKARQCHQSNCPLYLWLLVMVLAGLDLL